MWWKDSRQTYLFSKILVRCLSSESGQKEMVLTQRIRSNNCHVPAMLATRAGIASSSVGLVHSYCLGAEVPDISLDPSAAAADADEKKAGCCGGRIRMRGGVLDLVSADRWLADRIVVDVENPLAAPSGEMNSSIR